MGFYVVQCLSGLAQASSLFLVAAGLSIIFGVTRIVNFAHGSFYMVGAYIAVSLAERWAGVVSGFWGAVAIAALGTGLLGVASWRCWCCAGSTRARSCSSCSPPSASC